MAKYQRLRRGAVLEPLEFQPAEQEIQAGSLRPPLPAPLATKLNLLVGSDPQPDLGLQAGKMADLDQHGSLVLPQQWKADALQPLGGQSDGLGAIEDALDEVWR